MSFSDHDNLMPYSCQNLKQLLEQGKALKVGFYAFSSGISRENLCAQLFTGPSKGTKLMVKSVF